MEEPIIDSEMTNGVDDDDNNKNQEGHDEEKEETTTENIAQEPCRLCDDISEKMFNIFEENPQGYQLIGLIKENLPIVVRISFVLVGGRLVGNNCTFHLAIQNRSSVQACVRQMRPKPPNDQQPEENEPENSGKVRRQAEN